MASKKITAMPNWGGNQVPTDLLTGVDLSEPVATQNVKSTLNDVFDEITKNVTNLSIQFATGDGVSPVSATSKGRLRYSSAAVSGAGSFQVSESAGAYQNLIKGPASAGNLTANLFPFATAGDVVGDTALAQLGSTTSRVAHFNPFSPGSSLAGYGAFRFSIVDEGAFHTFGLLGILPSIRSLFFGGTLSSPTAATAGTVIFQYLVGGQYSTTVGQVSNGAIIRGYATESWSATNGGGSLAFFTNKQAVAVNNPVLRLLINQLGCVHVAPDSPATTGTSATGTLTLFQVGGGTGISTIDNNAIAFIQDNTNVGSAAVKQLVLQQKVSQTGSLFETQYTSGVAGFAIKPVSSVQGHFLDWLGTTNPPAVSAAGSARLYVDSSGVIQVSQNGAAYTPLAGSGSPGGASGTVQFNNAGAFGGVTSSAVSGAAVTWDGNQLVNSTGATTGSPRLVGFGATTGSQATRLQFDGEPNGVLCGNNQRLIIYSYWGLNIFGHRELTSAPFFETGASGDSTVYIKNAAGARPVLDLDTVSSPTADVLRVRNNGTTIVKYTPGGSTINAVFGNTALATSATDGFVYQPTITGGNPTGTPTAFTGTGAYVIENNTGSAIYRAWAYLNGAWRNMRGPTTVQAKTTAYTVVTADSEDRVFTNEGATASVNFTLPSAAANLIYTFYVQDADGVQVTAAAGDTIRIGASVSAAAGNISAVTIGNSVTLVAINATEWVAISVIGTWVVM